VVKRIGEYSGIIGWFVRIIDAKLHLFLALKYRNYFDASLKHCKHKNSEKDQYTPIEQSCTKKSIVVCAATLAFFFKLKKVDNIEESCVQEPFYSPPNGNMASDTSLTPQKSTQSSFTELQKQLFDLKHKLEAIRAPSTEQPSRSCAPMSSISATKVTHGLHSERANNTERKLF